ncbi:hypothetical protein PUN4_1000027 [Paraburkholderia unamae]|nr:hypothetical protein PUN4_1000027 [Paraburkholderia unamae]
MCPLDHTAEANENRFQNACAGLAQGPHLSRAYPDYPAICLIFLRFPPSSRCNFGKNQSLSYPTTG